MPYNDNYANDVKVISSKKIVFTGYIKNQIELTALYKLFCIYSWSRIWGNKSYDDQCS